MRGKRNWMAALLTAAMLFCAASSAWAEEAPAFDLMDNVIEFDEVGDLVENYSIIAKMQAEMIESMTNSFEDVERAVGLTYNETRDQFDAQIADLEDLRDNTEDRETRRELTKNISILRASRSTALKAASGIWDDGHNGGLSKTRDSIERNVKSQFYNGKKLMISGLQGAIFTWYSLSLSKKLVEKQIAMYQVMYEKTVRQQSLGQATEADVQSALLNQNSAKITLEQLDNGMNSIRRSVGLSLGWSTETYPNIIFGSLPEYDLAFADGRDLEYDIQRALEQNHEYGVALKTRDTEQTKWNSQKVALAATEQEVRIAMASLLQEVRQKRVEYESASTSSELARLKKERADRMDELGLVGRAEYEGLQLDYLSKENAVETARLAFNQAAFNYEQAVKKGVMTLGE